MDDVVVLEVLGTVDVVEASVVLLVDEVDDVELVVVVGGAFESTAVYATEAE
jgi:hypothetical protein